MSHSNEDPSPVGGSGVGDRTAQVQSSKGLAETKSSGNNIVSFSAAGASKSPPASKTQPRRKPNVIGGGKQITRTRVSYSCHTCRRRKVKCDKVHPVCGNCVKTGTECIYDSRTHRQKPHYQDNQSEPRFKRRRSIPDSTERQATDSFSPYHSLRELQEYQARLGEQKPGQGSDEIAARLDRLTSMIERLSRTNDSNVPEGSGGHTYRSVTSSGSVSRQSSSKRNSDNNSNEEFPIPGGLSTDLVDPVGTLNLGHLSLEDGCRPRYVGTTYWAYISDEINELNQLLREQNPSQPSQQSEPTAPQDEEQRYAFTTTPNQHETRAEDQGFLSTCQDTMQESILFPTYDSPSSQGKHVEVGMFDHMPTRRQSNILFKGFMSGVQAISPVVHPPTVLVWYEAFWAWFDNREHSTEPFKKLPFIPMLYAIWYCGSVTISLRTIHAEFDVETRSALSEPFHDGVTRWLKKLSFPRSASLHGLTAFLLVQTVLAKEEEPLTSSLFVSLALRVAQTMGLHRDPAQFGVNHCEAETRRRIWWHIVHMDVIVAMSSGLPPLVSEENYWDVRITSEVKDTLLGSSAAEEYERVVNDNRRRPDKPDDPNVCGSSMVNVYYISAKGKYIMARAIRNILKIQLGTSQVTRKDMEDLKSILIDLQSKLRGLVDRIPIPKTQSSDDDASSDNASTKPDLPNGGPCCCEQYHTPVLAAFHKWAKILLSLFVHKAFCVAYQPFLKNAKSKIWPAARHCALRHCHGFMEKFILLATDPDFQPFQWSWPGNHQPMHATMIMLIDLYERPTSPEAPKSRAFIDKIFSLSGPDGGVVGGEDGVSTARPLKDGGREAWDMMRRLREKAWQKAGLDPQVLWTEQAQVQAGVAPITSPSASVDSSKEKSTSPTTNFADTYYAMIKDSKSHGRQRPKEVERPKEDLPTSFPQRNILSPQQMPSMPAWPGSIRETGPLPQSNANAEFWPPPPEFQIPSNSPLNQMPSVGSGEIPGFIGQTPTGYTSPQTSIGSLSGISRTPPASANNNAKSKQAHTQQTDYNANSTAQQSQPNNNFDHNYNFDWDQWDAVFGQYLPVVDGYMDLDNGDHSGNQGIASGDHPLSYLPITDADLGLERGQKTGRNSGGARNWADFG